MNLRSKAFLNTGRVLLGVGLFAWFYWVYVLSDRPCYDVAHCWSLQDSVAELMSYGIWIALIGAIFMTISLLAKGKKN